jgi:quercetin 2,3-dioxygenase
MIPPAYQGLEADEVTLLSSPDGGALVRVIAGQVGGHAGPGSTHTPMALMHATVSPGAKLRLPWNPTFNALVYVLAGSGRAGTAGPPIQVGQLASFAAGDWISVQADDARGEDRPDLDILVLGGQPIGEHVEHYGPFVMNTRAEIAQALDDFQAGRLGTIPPNALMPSVPDPEPVRAEHTWICGRRPRGDLLHHDHCDPTATGLSRPRRRGGVPGPGPTVAVGQPGAQVVRRPVHRRRVRVP